MAVSVTSLRCLCNMARARMAIVSFLMKVSSPIEINGRFSQHYVLKTLDEQRSPVIITERKDHAHQLAERLSHFARNVLLFHGGMGVRQRREIMQRLEEIAETEERVLIATGRYIGEGFDDARLDTLFLAMPVSWKGVLAQYVGRLHRPNPAKREVLVYDYVDYAVPMLKRMSEKRLRGYKNLGYLVDNVDDR